MHDDRQVVEDRVTRMLENRIKPARYKASRPCNVRMWETPQRSVPFGQVIAEPGQFRALETGQDWGSPWHTTWLEITGAVPDSWHKDHLELLVDLGFTDRNPGYQAEGMAYDTHGKILKGIEPDNHWVPLDGVLQPDGQVTVFVEAAANPPLGGRWDFPVPTLLGDEATSGGAFLYRFGGSSIVAVDEEVVELALDIEVTDGLMRALALGDPRRHELLRTLERALDRLDPRDVARGAAEARAMLAPALRRPAVPSAHRCSAVGHAHIDTAFLWPLAETVRKCGRTFANVADLMDREPGLVFACSQAQHYDWVKQNYPDLYARVKRHVERGRWVPVGGMWVEADTVISSGESLARQFIHGQRFFETEFGTTCREAWLPDSFGYSGALPQLAKLAGMRYFFAQKLAWNQTNRFPHHTFIWEGIDGSRLFTHFPPVETYNATLAPSELAHAVSTYAEHGFATSSLVPFGYGDGGGGPTREMIGRARRLADVEGAPRVTIESPSQFFAAAAAEYVDPPVWAGEMYLELHRGCFTSQAQLKRANRECEHLLREAELWCATASARGPLEYPYDDLASAWKVLLVHQFHDILPGSSVAQVNREAVAAYAQLKQQLEEMVARAQEALAGRGDKEVVFNSAPHAQAGVLPMGAGLKVRALEPPARCEQADGGTLVLDNGLVRAEFDHSGLVVSLCELQTGREVVPPQGRLGLLQLHWDLPNQSDAWDVERSYLHHIEDIDSVCATRVVAEGNEDVARVEVDRVFGSSSVTQVFTVQRGLPYLVIENIVDWEEVERFLKLSFPLDVQALDISAEVQFGHVRRPTHNNTSWEAARFEQFAHRFVHVGEARYGVAIVNDATYGFDVARHARGGSGWTTTVRASLVRGPQFPDPRADRGRHRFSFKVIPGADIGDAVAEGYRANLPVRRRLGAGMVRPIVTVDDRAVVVEVVKLADDRSGDLVVRCYESLGGRARANLSLGMDATSVCLCDLLEQPVEDARAFKGSVEVEFRPFEITTLRFSTGAPVELLP